MTKDMTDMLERIRERQAWPEDDLLLVLHVKQKDWPMLEKLLQQAGLNDADAVEIGPA